MTDTELADALVELGIGEHVVYKVHGTVDYKMVFGESIKAKDFVNDWRVAGRCLEMFPKADLDLFAEIYDYETCGIDNAIRNPRAIIEAFVEAKTQEG